jgi:DNA replication protein DnaC
LPLWKAFLKGKTHLGVALGIKACMAKYRMVFIPAQKLLEKLMCAKLDMG